MCVSVAARQRRNDLVKDGIDDVLRDRARAQSLLGISADRAIAICAFRPGHAQRRRQLIGLHYDRSSALSQGRISHAGRRPLDALVVDHVMRAWQASSDRLHPERGLAWAHQCPGRKQLAAIGHCRSTRLDVGHRMGGGQFRRRGRVAYRRRQQQCTGTFSAAVEAPGSCSSIHGIFPPCCWERPITSVPIGSSSSASSAGLI
jgi:hypothetical protein